MGKQFFTSKEATRIIGCSIRQLQYWRDKGVVVPTVSGTGTGRSIYYNYSDLVDLAIMKHGLDMGLSFDTARKCLAQLRDGQPDYINPETKTQLMLYWNRNSDCLKLAEYDQNSAIALLEQGKLVIPLRLDQIHHHLINNLQTTESSSSSNQQSSEQTSDLTYHQMNASNLILGSILAGQKRLLVEMLIKAGTSKICAQFCRHLYQLKWNIEGKKRAPRILFIVEHQDKIDFVINDFLDVFKEKQLFKVERQVKTKHIIYFASSYNLVGNPSLPNLYRFYNSDYFDLIIVENYADYRGSNQFQSILDYFEPAYQLAFISMDSPEKQNEAYEHFGKPIYQYSLKELFEDGLIKA